MKFNWFYIFIIALFFMMLFVTFRYFRGSRHSTVGITHSREHKINAEKPAQVKAIKVAPGQQVKQGDLLIELTSNDLDIEIAKLTNRILALQSEKNEKSKLAQAEISYIRASEGVAIEKINSDIVEAEGEMQLNKKLTKNFGISTDSTQRTPIALKVDALKKQRTKHEEAIAIRVQDILQKSNAEQQLVNNQIGLLERELALLNEEQRVLNKYAAADGVVENVYVRMGEHVDAFTPLLSLNLVHPVTVVGYQVGKKDPIAIGAAVNIRSYEHSSTVVNGKVIGYGAVVELPEILQKSTAVKAFGREVFIEIPAENDFATGEKVLIR
jgi:multidrug resistance efflux pump